MEFFKALNSMRSNEQLTDIEIEIISPQFQKTIPVHKVILAVKCPYFMKLFCGNFMESKQQKIKINVSNGYVFLDMINEFYGEYTNTGNLSYGNKLLETIVCKNFFGLPIDNLIEELVDIKTDNYDLLFQVAEITNYCYQIKKAIFKNIGKEYYDKLPEWTKNNLKNHDYHFLIIQFSHCHGLHYYMIDRNKLMFSGHYFKNVQDYQDYDLSNQYFAYSNKSTVSYINLSTFATNEINFPGLISYKISNSMNKIITIQNKTIKIYKLDDDSLTTFPLQTVYDNETKIEISPNEKYFYIYPKSRSLDLYHIDGSGLSFYSWSDPVFSPDSQYLLYSNCGYIYLRPILDNLSLDSISREVFDTIIPLIHDVCFTKNGQYIIILSDALHIFNLDRQMINRIELTAIKKIEAYIENKIIACDNHHLFLIDVLSSEIHQLINPINQSKEWHNIEAFTVNSHQLANPFC